MLIPICNVRFIRVDRQFVKNSGRVKAGYHLFCALHDSPLFLLKVRSRGYYKNIYCVRPCVVIICSFKTFPCAFSPSWIIVWITDCFLFDDFSLYCTCVKSLFTGKKQICWLVKLFARMTLCREGLCIHSYHIIAYFVY